MSQESINYNPIDNSSNLIEILSIPSRLRTEKGVSKAIQYIKNLHPFANLLYSNNSKIERQLTAEIASILYHKKYDRNTIVKRACEIDSKVFIILRGEVVELGIKYDKIKLTEKEYLIHLIKLAQINEKEMVSECIKQNKNKFPINANYNNIVNWIKDNYQENSMSYIHKANEEIKQCKRLYQDQSMNYYLNITNPFDIEEHNNIRIGSKMKYLLLIPSYCYVKTLQIGNYIGSFSLNKKYKLYSTYITLRDTSIGIIEKTSSGNSNTNSSANISANAYRLINNIIKEDICELMKYFFIFQTFSSDYFENILSPLLTYRTVKKEDIIMRQNSCFEGIYFVKNGQFKITTRRSLDDLMMLIIMLKQSLDNFIGVTTHLKDNILEDYNSHLNPSNNNNKLYNDSENKIIQEIIIMTTNSRHIIGLNEYYSCKTDIVNFNVECLSETAEVFFLPKESFFSIIEKNEPIKCRITKLIEQNVHYFIQTIRRFRDKAIIEAKLASIKYHKKERNTNRNNINTVFHFPITLSSKNSNRLIHLKIINGLNKHNSHLSFLKDISSKSYALKKTSSHGLLLYQNKQCKDDNKNKFNNTYNGKRIIQTPILNKQPLELLYTRNKTKMIRFGSFRIKV